ncbi:MAG: serine protease [Klebsiella pneumoniae]|nr:serine protease [Klebsiella pneumoniae]
MSEQWKKAVIHLECATDSKSIYDRLNEEEELDKKLRKGEITSDEYREKTNFKSRDVRCQGTALFISHNGKRYLLTARHVLFDEISAKGLYDLEGRIVSEHPSDLKERSLSYAHKRSLNTIFNCIFRVPSLDEVLSGRNAENRESLNCLGSGLPDSLPYIFSPPELDLAIISLDNRRNEYFANELEELGYSPIPSNLIKDEPSKEGADIFTIGFPGAVSLLGKTNLDSASAHWASNYFSLPVFSWGKVSMLHTQLPFYWCDMSIYPGNSGGPVIEDGNLVGVVSAQAVLPIEGLPQITTRIPFAKIIKTSYVKKLIEDQEAKEQK